MFFFDVIKSKIENNDFPDTPIIPLKYYIFMCVQNPLQEEYYEKAEKIFYNNLDVISPNEKAYINTGLINYCWLRVGLGDEIQLKLHIVFYEIIIAFFKIILVKRGFQFVVFIIK